MRYHYFIAVTLATFFCLHNPVAAQQLPANPDPNKCYVRTVTADEYVFTYTDYLTYTSEDATHYPHQELELIVAPEYSLWEAASDAGCASDDPNDCQVLCYRTYPAKTVTIYEPLNDTIGSPHWIEVEFKEKTKTGGLTGYVEIDCALTRFSEIPIEWYRDDITELTYRDKQALNEMIVDLLRYEENLRIQIEVHTDTNGSVSELEEIASWRATSILNHLQDQFINTERIVFKAWGGKQPRVDCGNPTPCSDMQNKQNERVIFRVLSMDY